MSECFSMAKIRKTNPMPNFSLHLISEMVVSVGHLLERCQLKSIQEQRTMSEHFSRAKIRKTTPMPNVSLQLISEIVVSGGHLLERC